MQYWINFVKKITPINVLLTDNAQINYYKNNMLLKIMFSVLLTSTTQDQCKWELSVTFNMYKASIVTVRSRVLYVDVVENCLSALCLNLLKGVINHYGAPKQVLSDNISALRNKKVSILTLYYTFFFNCFSKLFMIKMFIKLQLFVLNFFFAE